MKAAVVIPLYKANPNEEERASLVQTQKVFQDETILLVVPEGLDLTEYQSIMPNVEVKYFKKTYFSSIKAYNSLLLSATFYKSFKAYDYILLTQADVWVFDNQLLKWCKRNYDYIGAPWLVKPPLQKKINLLPFASLMKGKVGNGGFSLRKISSHIEISRKLSPISWIFTKNEDFFWSIIVPKFFSSFVIPKIEVAVFFAFELAPEKALKMTGGKLPFAVHAWLKHNPDFWKTFIPLVKN